MTDFDRLRQLGDASMRSGDIRCANEHYYAAWDDYAAKRKEAAARGTVEQFDEAHTAENAFWLLLSGANAQFCIGDFDGCLDTGVAAFNLFKDLGLVVGNPFFHLRVGQASFEVEAPESRDENGMAIDNLARALICGGIEIFKHEDAKYLDAVLKVLRPPAGFSSWHEATGEGCSVDKLNGATGFLADFFATKYGSPPPYSEA